MHFIHLRMPTVKNFEASFFHWYVLPFQLVQSASTEFVFNKDTLTLKSNDAGLFKGFFFNFIPQTHTHTHTHTYTHSYFKNN